jgi:hypothetical protein
MDMVLLAKKAYGPEGSKKYIQNAFAPIKDRPEYYFALEQVNDKPVDGVWNVYFNCNTKLNLLVALIIGGGIGALWSFIIDSTKQVELQYFNGIANKNVCKVSPKQKFRCTTTSS